MAARAEAITKPFMMGRYRAVRQMRVAAVVVVYGMVIRKSPRERRGVSERWKRGQNNQQPGFRLKRRGEEKKRSNNEGVGAMATKGKPQEEVTSQGIRWKRRKEDQLQGDQEGRKALHSPGRRDQDTETYQWTVDAAPTVRCGGELGWGHRGGPGGLPRGGSNNLRCGLVGDWPRRTTPAGLINAQRHESAEAWRQA
jgi:hypothetical protein